jgi:hypothetical protein
MTTNTHHVTEDEAPVVYRDDCWKYKEDVPGKPAGGMSRTG